MHVACKYHDSLRGNPRLVEMTRVVEMPRLVSLNATRDATTRLVEKKFSTANQAGIFTRQILRGAMHVHACKSEVINERYCSYSPIYILNHQMFVHPNSAI